MQCNQCGGKGEIVSHLGTDNCPWCEKGTTMREVTRKEIYMTLEEFKVYDVPVGWTLIAVYSHVEYKSLPAMSHTRSEFVREIVMHVTIEEVTL